MARKEKANVVPWVVVAVGVMLVAAGVIYSNAGPDDVTSSGTMQPAANHDEMMEDGRITFDEYEDALRAAIRCAEAQGVEVSPPVVGADGVTLDYSIYSGVLGESAIEIFDDCYSMHAHSVDVHFQTSPEVAAARDAFERAMRACMQESGIDVEDFTLYPLERPGVEFETCRELLLAPHDTVATLPENV